MPDDDTKPSNFAAIPRPYGEVEVAAAVRGLAPMFNGAGSISGSILAGLFELVRGSRHGFVVAAYRRKDRIAWLGVGFPRVVAFRHVRTQQEAHGIVSEWAEQAEAGLFDELPTLGRRARKSLMPGY